MRVVIDAMGAPRRSGGMKVHAEEFIDAWLTQYPDDDVVLVGYAWLYERFAEWERVQVRVYPEGGMARRFITQTLVTPQLARRGRADAIISLSTIVSAVAPRGTVTSCFIHDWRHIGSPEEFSRVQRVFRSLWKLSIRASDVTFAISAKTLRETQQIAKPRQLVLAENGGDHPERWSPPELTQFDAPTVLTFGHLPNKRPELVVRAVAELSGRGVDVRAIVLGASGAMHDAVSEVTASLGVSDRIDLPGFVDDAEFHSLLRSADVVALMSSDEGYGFPVVEAHYFGKPVIVATDSGLEAIHGARVTAVPPDVVAVADALVELLGTDGFEPASSVIRWADTVEIVRETLRERIVAA